MSIQGDLSIFTIPELFQFLHQHSKDGCLNIKEDRQDLAIYFQEGKIVGVCPKGQSPTDFWCEILLRTGYLSEDEEKHLKKRKTHDLASVREILVKDGVASYLEQSELLQRRCQEMLLEVLKLKKGTFSLSTEDSVPSDIKLSEPISVEAFLLDGLRMLDEWPIIFKRIGSFQRIPCRQARAVTSGHESSETTRGQGIRHSMLKFLGMRGDAARIDTAQVDGEEAWSSTEREVYKRINGKRTIQEIIDESMWGEYPVCKALLTLVEGGWVELTPHAPLRRGRDGIPRGSGKPLLHGVYLFSIILFLSLVVHSVHLGDRGGDAFWNRVSTGKERLVYRYLNNQKRHIVAQALEMYEREYGAYPEALSLLVDRRLLREGDLDLLGKNRYEYGVRGQGHYELRIVQE